MYLLVRMSENKSIQRGQQYNPGMPRLKDIGNMQEEVVL